MFILSIILVFLVVGVIIVGYYNIALAIRGHPPFKVHYLLPQILFPRGAVGLGKHNFDDDNQTGVGQRSDYKELANQLYRPLNSSNTSPNKREYNL